MSIDEVVRGFIAGEVSGTGSNRVSCRAENHYVGFDQSRIIPRTTLTEQLEQLNC